MVEGGFPAPGLDYEPVFWQKVPVWLVRHKPVQNIIFNNVRLKLEVLARTHAGAELTAVAHSFGTLAFVRALEMKIVGFRAQNVVLVGSIVQRSFAWAGWLRSRDIGQVLNIARPFDWVVSRSGLVGGGYSGTRGFIEVNSTSVTNHFKRGGHSSYHPDDVNDVSTVIAGSFDFSQVTGFHDWQHRLPLFERSKYNLLRRLRYLR